MPSRIYRPTCAHQTGALLAYQARCDTCGQEYEFDGWHLRMHEAMAVYQYVYGLKPIGPHRPLAHELLGPLRVQCLPCLGRGIVTLPSSGSWEICTACEGTGGYWKCSNEELQRARRVVIDRFPEAEAPCAPPSFVSPGLAHDLGRGVMLDLLKDAIGDESPSSPELGRATQLRGEVWREQNMEEKDLEPSLWSYLSPEEIGSELDRYLEPDDGDGLQAGIFRSVGRPDMEVLVRSLLEVRTGNLELFEDICADHGFMPDILGEAVPTHWVLRCEVLNSMVSGEWGLMETRLGGRGYLFSENPDRERGPQLLGAWEPAEDCGRRRRCILDVYHREWQEQGWPPIGGEQAEVDADLLFDALLRLASEDQPPWGNLRDGIYAPDDFLTAERVARRAAEIGGVPIEAVYNVLDRLSASYAVIEWNPLRDRGTLFEATKSSDERHDEERRTLIALYVVLFVPNSLQSRKK